MEFIYFLFQDYLKRRLLERTNRAIIIFRLETRITKALISEKRYSIFRKYLYRNLLQQRSVNQKTDRIKYKTQTVLLWLQMVYNRGIQFIDIPFSKVNQIYNLQFNKKYNYIFNKKGKYILITNIGSFQNCSLEEKGIYYAILDFSKTKRGQIQYDIIGGEDIVKIQVIGLKLCIFLIFYIGSR